MRAREPWNAFAGYAKGIKRTFRGLPPPVRAGINGKRWSGVAGLLENLVFRRGLECENSRLPYYHKSGPPELPRFYKGNPIDELTPPSIQLYVPPWKSL